MTQIHRFEPDEPGGRVVEMLPTWPFVRCDECRRVYRVTQTSGFVVGDCPECGGQRFSTSVVSTPPSADDG